MDKTLPSELKLASFWKRVAARLIDSTLAYVVIYLIILLSFKSEDYNGFQGIWWLIIFFIYYPLTESSGGTIGKWMVGLITLNINTLSYPSFISILLRSFTLFASLIAIIPLILLSKNHDSDPQNSIRIFEFIGIVFFVPFLIFPLAVTWTKHKQGYHDMFANVIVVTKKSYLDYTDKRNESLTTT